MSELKVGEFYYWLQKDEEPVKVVSVIPNETGRVKVQCGFKFALASPRNLIFISDSELLALRLQGKLF